MTMSLDAQDRKILAALQKRGRLSSQELAEETGVSPATCWRRLKALEEAGVIEAYRAVLDREKLGLAVCAFVHVSIERQYPEYVDEIEEKIRRRPEVLECYATTGDADFTLRVVARDIADYDRFLQKFLFELPGVGRVRSSIALREIKQTTELPLERES
ncbi:Lrp/AsnC family transcriptional regulator [Amphiplicatus metriothermophilus]|uniref:Transcriptional regulator, AsnC family n=1 Tax=Amphiplicatus metriothermophilus TaxID=1519374 RepID=A0A239PQD8_9PROT|nr:Lrp/AsnC family transcriptional regulator [Amphiplicatus metriothermophilus]MBB5518499.1 DNA-binding Lrp family transcriptional regulator [Amphiplicatus metriothermophilus]SNT72340.1 transcriptional regulator, AsnC family [Amphiplicatus metriothermophilus]